MADVLRSSTVRCPPPRQAQGTVLNTIMEDTRESHFVQSTKTSPPSRQTPATFGPHLTLKTSGLSVPTHARLARLLSPLSAATASSCCSDAEWESQIPESQGYDDLYDATDDDSISDTETDISDSCFSPDTRPSSLVTPITRNSVTSTGSRKHYLTLEIPSPTKCPSITGAHKSSPVPPTPPPKIPISPAALSMLSRAVPASYAPPSLDGSLSSDQESIISGLATPDSHSLPDTNWDAHDIRVRGNLDGSESDLEHDDARSDIQEIPIAIESREEDWRHVLGSFPLTPRAAQAYSPSSPSLHLSDEPTEEYDDLYDAPEHFNRGVYLPDSALAMLHHIHLDGTPDSASETSEDHGEMRQLEIPTSRPKSADGLTPASALSSYSFSDLSIPSPGGFFASLAPRSRHTWSIPEAKNRPSSAAAEGFYSLPWRRDEGEIVEQVVEWPQRPVNDDPVTAVRDEEGPLTAIRLCETPTRRSIYQESPMSAAFDHVQVQEIPRSVKGYEYDECYDQELQYRATVSHDRTSVWLAAQQTYLSALSESNPVNEIEPVESSEPEMTEAEAQDATEEASHKVVRFAESIPEALSPLPPILASKDSIYWQGFQSLRERSSKTDGFMHRNVRFDAVQSMRLAMSDVHINCLTGKYELVRPERPAYKGPFAKAPRNSVITSELAEKAQFAKLEKEQLVLTQLCQSMWAMDALRSLNGGNLVTSPAQQILARTTRKPSLTQGPHKRSFRILDLGGHASCDWAWQVAHEFPNVKVYTVATKGQVVNSAIKGPPNHRQVTVDAMWELPFGNNQFDVISARSLHALLKTERPAGKDRDEYDLVLKECMRCLKPGGYLEFQVLDAEISRAGPYASATSVEFAFTLRTRGYDPVASKSFLNRLRNAGFGETKRGWMFLPMGTEAIESEPPRETPAPRVQSHIEDLEAVQGPVGSTADIAGMTGLIGGWMWEQWLLKLRMEMGRERFMLLEGVGALFDEGRKSGAGWTCLSGWAMKPKRNSSRSSKPSF